VSVRQIVRSFDEWRAQSVAMVMATVYETEGSTYSKAGHRILIAHNGDYQGLVSGGCLEGDIAERARTVLEAGAASAVSYDLRDDADDLWGLGVGCNGLIRVFLQPLLPAHDYEPFSSIARAALRHEAASVGTVIAPGSTSCEAGATMIWRPDSTWVWHVDELLRERLQAGCRRSLEERRGYYDVGTEGLGVLYAPLVPIPRLLILGAGLDAVPLVNMAAELGWSVTVVDHRPAYLERGGFAAAERVQCLDPRTLAGELQLDPFDAVIVMSHHLVTDRIYLSQLERTRIGYIGVLGPPTRKQRLLEELGEQGKALAARLKGPVGLDIGAHTPESIALSILAELQAHMTDTHAQSLS
jgi:xanthine dehydrogenase accessory factor